MDKTKGIAYCGLACCVCSENKTCPGCRNEGCTNRDWCKNFACCREKGLKGCWECPDFPCPGTMLDKTKIRTFARYVREHGEEALMCHLERNEQNGVIYHFPGGITGDYDLSTEEEVLTLLEQGKQESRC